MSVPLTHGRYRGAHNTGIPDGTVLNVPEPALTWTGAGSVISNRVFIGQTRFDSSASNYIFRRCEFHGANSLYAIDCSAIAAGSNIMFEDCLIDGGPQITVAAAVNLFNAELLRCEVRGGADCIKVATGAIVRQSWAHDPFKPEGGHCDLIQQASGTGVIVEDSKFHGDVNIVNGAAQFGTMLFAASGIYTNNYFNGTITIMNGNLNTVLAETFEFRGNRFGTDHANLQVVGNVKNYAEVWLENVDDLSGNII